jgi:hypothetical protein
MKGSFLWRDGTCTMSGASIREAASDASVPVPADNGAFAVAKLEFDSGEACGLREAHPSVVPGTKQQQRRRRKLFHGGGCVVLLTEARMMRGWIDCSRTVNVNSPSGQVFCSARAYPWPLWPLGDWRWESGRCWMQLPRSISDSWPRGAQVGQGTCTPSPHDTLLLAFGL